MDQALFHTPALFSSSVPLPADCAIALAENGGQNADVATSDLVESFEMLRLSAGGVGDGQPSAPAITPPLTFSTVEDTWDSSQACGHVHQQVALEASPSLPSVVQPLDSRSDDSNEVARAALDTSSPNSSLLIIAHEFGDLIKPHRPLLGLEIPFGALPELTLFNCVTAIVQPVVF